MKFTHKVGTMAMVAVAGLGTAVLPAASANAAPFPVCPAVVAACTWTGTAYEGDLRLLFSEEQVITPGVRSVSNQDVQSWCFYKDPLFSGQNREVGRGKAVRDLGFEARSAKQGGCSEEE
ncbi:hypothetical protein [Streptomyces anulatus]|uniref:hypothetical protein n=1 Tax=Streptomyces anulatus TaxID=1892 RepID=UPI00386A860A|nr:hypothetical protein OG238_40365 [Streptomyces anulatus]